MNIFERAFWWLVGPGGTELSLPDENAEQILRRLSGTSSLVAPYRLPTVKQALGVPAIQRANALIASTTGMLTMQGFQRGAVMDEPPALITRPDPYQTPLAFYAGTAANMSKYGEFVWWIASYTGDMPAALVSVPLNELKVEPNESNRLMPTYTWGDKRGTRYSGANRAGRFVHEKYPLCEPLALRGEGPLQLCRAATSVTVEAQEWAANFYAGGGTPSVVIKHAGELSPEVDDDGYNEAERLRNQFMEKAHNVPRVIDQNIESIETLSVNEQGAQMLDARQHQNGDAARMYGIPGSLLEYQQAGSSLTYQNLEGEFTKFIRTCLQPLYLEPIEQAMSDLLPRSMSARFNVKGFLRADIKTRFDVHKIAIETGIYDAPYAQAEEGIIAGDVEFAPVPFAPPSAIPAPVKAASMRDVRCPRCSRLVARASGPVEGWCRHCKAMVAA